MFPRFIEARVRESLSDTRVVLVTGPRQAGKTTLVRKIAGAGTPYFSLDDSTILAAARTDPVGFIRGLDRATIDEIQRVPELVLAIKRSVDDDRRPGRFLLTGSANLLTLPTVADSLAGRMSILDLLPLSVAEIQRRPSRFLADAFQGRVHPPANPIQGEELVACATTGGYPEALQRPSWRRRSDWCRDYLRAIVERDVRDIANIEHLQLMPRLLRALAHHSGQVANYSRIGAALGMNHVTTQKYSRIAEQLFLVRTLPAWAGNELTRLIKAPKLHFLDSGLLSALLELSPERLAADRGRFGPLLETFVVSELLKQADWEGGRFAFSHFRDKQQNEVDVVIENDHRQVLGLEVKAAATVGAGDFAGLRKLAEATGKRFVMGLVLHDDSRVVPFGPNLYAAPISSLWA
ncbi:MAG TPA: ATP-binding protein [Opitutaceae bacterium]|jgi:hypothetical protein|nr:ATP-binding protein [Opitutaceae bacterium]